MTHGVLCLHGSRQTGEVLRTRLYKIIARTGNSLHFVFPDGPIELDLLEGDNVPLRAWLSDDVDNEAVLVDTLAAVWATNTNMRGVFGFSQGGVVACMIAQPQHASRFPGLEFVVVCGTPDSAVIAPTARSLVVAGCKDLLVSFQSSTELAARLNAQLQLHDEGHSLPKDIQPICDFLLASADTNTLTLKDAQVAQEQRDELEALQAIFAEHIEVEQEPVLGGKPAKLSVALFVDACSQLPALEEKWTRPGGIRIKFALPPDYPNQSILSISLSVGTLSLADCPNRARRSLLETCRRVAESARGECSIFAVVSAAQDWLLSQTWQQGEEGGLKETVEAENEPTSASSVHSGSSQSHWLKKYDEMADDEAATASLILEANTHADAAAAQV